MAISYTINKEKNVVTAILSNTKDDAFNSISKKLKRSGLSNMKIALSDEFMMKDNYVAIVRMDPNDTWDESVGKAKAKERVMKKYYKDFDRIMSKFSNNICRIMDNL